MLLAWSTVEAALCVALLSSLLGNWRLWSIWRREAQRRSEAITLLRRVDTWGRCSEADEIELDVILLAIEDHLKANERM